MKRSKSCEQVLMEHFLRHGAVWFKKVDLYSVAEDWSPETVGRTLRDMEESKKITVGKYDGKYAKGLAKYILGNYEAPRKPTYKVINGVAVFIP